MQVVKPLKVQPTCAVCGATCSIMRAIAGVGTFDLCYAHEDTPAAELKGLRQV